MRMHRNDRSGVRDGGGTQVGSGARAGVGVGVGGWAGSLARLGRSLWAGLLPAGRADRERELQLIETLTLGPKKQVHLLACAGRQFLVGSGAEGVLTIVPVGWASEQSAPIGGAFVHAPTHAFGDAPAQPEASDARWS